MNNRNRLNLLNGCLPTAVLIFVALTTQMAGASTLWTGPTINYSQSGPAFGSSYTGTPDVLVPGKVSLARNGNNCLYNPAAGETAAGLSSPADVTFAYGTLSPLPAPGSFVSLASLRNGALYARIVGSNMVMHLVNEDIYLTVRFTSWNHGFTGGSFSYTRSTPSAVVPPTVSITNPSSGAVFAAPANVMLAANASVTGGTVTNVSFFNGASPLGSVQTAPFDLTASSLAAGAYSFTAVATASGLSATSSVVNVTVVTPIAVLETSPQISGGQFSFSYSADPGLRYVVLRSADLVNWTPVATNRATSNPVAFSDPLTANSTYYRVARLPNP